MLKEASDIRNEIRKIQLQRQLAQQRHEVTTSRFKQRFNAAQARLRNSTEFQRSNCRSIYAETLEELMGPCRPPEEARLLEVSHMIEINQHLLEIMVVQMRNLTDYMVCEINVLEEERKEIQEEHAAKYTLLLEGMHRFTDSFQTSSKPQRQTRRSSGQPSMAKRRSSCETSRRGSVGSGLPFLRRPFPSFSPDEFPDDDELSVVSDLSMSVASAHSWCNGKSVATTDTVSSRGELDSPYSHSKRALVIPESERFTVIKL